MSFETQSSLYIFLFIYVLYICLFICVLYIFLFICVFVFAFAYLLSYWNSFEAKILY